MPLTKPAVSELNLEGSHLDLWHEWLSLWFDGQNHVVGANSAVKFPAAVLRYQQHDLPKPLEGLTSAGKSPDGVAISVVWIGGPSIRYTWDTVGGLRQRMAFARTGWMFWVRAEVTEKGEGNAKLKCRDTADRLFAVLENSAATRDLAGKGIHRLRPTPPSIVSEGSSGSKPGDPTYAMRLVSCSGTLHYPVRSQTGGET